MANAHNVCMRSGGGIFSGYIHIYVVACLVAVRVGILSAVLRGKKSIDHVAIFFKIRWRIDIVRSTVPQAALTYYPCSITKY